MCISLQIFNFLKYLTSNLIAIVCKYKNFVSFTVISGNDTLLKTYCDKNIITLLQVEHTISKPILISNIYVTIQ